MERHLRLLTSELSSNSCLLPSKCLPYVFTNWTQTFSIQIVTSVLFYQINQREKLYKMRKWNASYDLWVLNNSRIKSTRPWTGHPTFATWPCNIRLAMKRLMPLEQPASYSTRTTGCDTRQCRCKREEKGKKEKKGEKGKRRHGPREKSKGRSQFQSYHPPFGCFQSDPSRPSQLGQ